MDILSTGRLLTTTLHGAMRCTSCCSPVRAAAVTGRCFQGPRLVRPHRAISSSNFVAVVASCSYGGGRGKSQLGRRDSRCFASQVSSPVTENGPETSTCGSDSSAIPTAIKKRVVSGVQPTGTIHLGNYLGAIKNWVGLQDVHDTLFFVVDLHAITMAHEPKELFEATRKSAAMYIACGVDPSKASIFVQSHVQAHADLTWLLSCVTPISWLNKMIQFKEKARKAGEDVGTGLLTYPLLMASDILLYQCDLVPVGEDQRQHLELTRNVADRVNSLYGGRKWKKLGGSALSLPLVFGLNESVEWILFCAQNRGSQERPTLNDEVLVLTVVMDGYGSRI